MIGFDYEGKEIEIEKKLRKASIYRGVYIFAIIDGSREDYPVAKKGKGNK